MRLDDLTGRRFGRLTVIGRADRNGRSPKHTYWLCLCDCGNEAVATSQHLKSGHTKSCGCYSRERATVHGKRRTHLYKTWLNIKSRCNNPKATAYERYGGRGIKVCDEWVNDFSAFMDWSTSHGYAEGLTIDRIDNDGDYSPDNCRWATMIEQSNNTSANHRVTYNGETHSVSEWSRITGINKSTLHNRLKRGWDVERALTKPAQKHEVRQEVQK